MLTFAFTQDMTSNFLGKVLCLFDQSIHPNLVHIQALSLFLLCHWTSCFASIIINTTTRGFCLIINGSMGCNKPLPQTGYCI